MVDHTGRNSEPRSRLGRGLAALLGDTAEKASYPEQMQGITHVPIEFIRSSTKNPRQRFEAMDLDELADSIRERGIIQPILVRSVPDVRDIFEIIAGERRWRAAQHAGLHKVPVIVLNVGDREALEIAIVENVQRADLNALEEAAGYARLAIEFGYNHTDIARVVGKSRSHVANTLRLTNLPAHTRDLLSNGTISAGHARALLSLADPDTIADKIIADQLTVRDIENFAKTSHDRKRVPKIRDDAMRVDSAAMEQRLALSLGLPVRIDNSRGGFELRIRLYDVDQLTTICDRLLDQ
jgi:ParB family transcriptional regulator, chromosome partitioning protein